MTATPAEFDRAFIEERARTYPMIDAIERELGYAIDRARLESAARVLACPVKANPPNWQHGRVIYARLRAYLAGRTDSVFVLDIGTAKGFSALCALWALTDAGVPGSVTTVDVLRPKARVARNTVAECDGLKTLPEILSPWPEASALQCLAVTGLDFLHTLRKTHRIHAAFVDGKHAYDAVRREGLEIASRQVAGDLILFDDLQVAGVAAAIDTLSGVYELTPLVLHRDRGYALGVRR